jgi:hypothetical protein
MYSHVLLYRIGQKQILLRHIALCSLLIEKCESCLDTKESFEKFEKSCESLTNTNNMVDYLSELKLHLFN